MTEVNEDSNDAEPPEFIIPASIYSRDGFEFKDAESLHDWANKHHRFLAQLLNNIPHQEVFHVLFAPYKKIQKLTKELSESSELQKLDELKEVARSVSTGTTFIEGSRIHEIMRSMNLTAAFAAGYLVACFNIDPVHKGKPASFIVDNNHRQHFGAGWSIAHAYGVAGVSELAPSRERVDLMLSRAKEAAEVANSTLKENEELIESLETTRREESETTNATIERYLNTRIKRFVRLQKEFRIERKRILDQYKEHTALHDSVVYWNEQARIGYWAAALGAAVFAFVAWRIVDYVLVNGIGLLKNLFELVNEYPAIASNPLSFIGVATFPVVLILWALKFPARIFKEQLHLANDARHRATVIKTYLSLLRDPSNPVSPEERRFALQSIFGIPDSAQPDDPVPILQQLVDGPKK